MKDSVHSVYSWEIEYTVFNHESWSSQNFLMRDEVHSIDSQEIESIALRDVRVIFLIFPEGRGNDTGNFSS